MAIDLVATVGTTTANAYIDGDAAQAILDGVPNTDAWDSADADAQDVALVYATTLLNALAYKGTKVAAAQALAWPRYGAIDPDYGADSGTHSGYMVGEGNWGVYLDATAIPARVKRACALLALEILRAGTSDVWGVDASVDVKRKKVDVLETEYYDRHQRRLGLRKYPSVWREIFPLTLASEPASVERA